MHKKSLTGKNGEEAACRYLKDKGYVILEKNWRFRHKEIDIIARDRDEIVIVEVKTRDANMLSEPWESVTNKKIRNLVTAANAWIQQNNSDRNTRFDIISISTSGEDKFEIDHIKSAFLPPVY